MSIVVIATITPRPEHRAAVFASIAESVPAIHAELGCEFYAVHDAGDSVVIIEQWSDRSTLAAHGTGEPVQKVHAALEGKLAKATTLVHATPLPAGSGEKGTLA